MKRRKLHNLHYYICGIALLIIPGLILLMCGCASNKPSRAGMAAVNVARESAPNAAAGSAQGATSTALKGGKVLEGAREGVSSSAINSAGSAAAAITRELLK